ncbi:MAG TPA: hypothetical protein VNN79_22480 [Actinomycetota bacterium]|nr:hypothetical protein [Actinomycetota bacterium]
MPDKLKKLDIPSRAKSGRSIRGKKYIVPDCKVYETYRGETIPVTGPCKQPPVTTDSAWNTNYRDKWWETCTHGAPTREELDALGWTGPVSYFDKGYEDSTSDQFEKQPDGSLVVKGQVTTRKIVIRPRIEQVSASIRNNSGSGPAAAELYGARAPELFGIAPFCEYWDCFSQDLRDFPNGRFCSDAHSKLVFADENFKILAVGDGSGARTRRAEQLRELVVGR